MTALRQWYESNLPWSDVAVFAVAVAVLVVGLRVSHVRRLRRGVSRW